MTTGYGRGSGFLPRPPVVKHTSTAADAADDVKRREAVYLEGLGAARERLASWMIEHSLATGHGDTFEELLSELSWQVRELQKRRIEEAMNG